MDEQLRLFFRLYIHPLRAMSGILDHGNWMFGVIAAVVLSLAISMTAPTPAVVVPQPPVPGVPVQPHLSPVDFLVHGATSVSTVLTIFCIFVPLCLVLITLFERLGSITTVLFRDFASLLACCSLGWLAAYIPAMLAAVGSPQFRLGLVGLTSLYFLFLMVCAVQVVFGAGFTTSVLAVLMAFVATVILVGTGILSLTMPLLASPFLLFYGYRYFSGDLQSLGQGFRMRQAFRRHLEAATVNPADGDAHTQLGLIYQSRRQFDEAAARFRRAIEIDPSDPEAHLQLGRILRDQGKFEEALPHFQSVAKTNPKYSTYEVWREAGSVYLGLKRYNDAKPVLEHYIAQRPFDAEGLYYLGQTLQNLGETAPAKEAYERSVEAARTAPSHRKRFVNRWGRMSQRALSDLKKTVR